MAQNAAWQSSIGLLDPHCLFENVGLKLEGIPAWNTRLGRGATDSSALESSPHTFLENLQYVSCFNSGQKFQRPRFAQDLHQEFLMLRRGPTEE